jgi:hypothetical protein
MHHHDCVVCDEVKPQAASADDDFVGQHLGDLGVLTVGAVGVT